MTRNCRHAALVTAISLAVTTSITAGCDDGDTRGGAHDETTDVWGDGDALVGVDTDAPDSGSMDLAAALAERLCNWTPHADNPLILPPNSEFLIGDPTVVVPEEAPDGRWHLFANSVLGIHHYLSDDGLEWDKEPRALFSPGAFRAYVFWHDGTWNMVFEQFRALDRSEVQHSRSDDLFVWTTPTTVLTPTLPWEQTLQSTVGNPYVWVRDDELWLYYSADGVHQDDTGFAEPRVIGRARAETMAGPWTRDPEPMLAPDANDPWRNRGAGSIKLLDETVLGARIAFNNGIYATESLDGEVVSGSAISVLHSDDGVAWEDVCGGPILAPDGDGWDADFVYAFDSVRVGDTLRLYYNARQGHAEGTERIGVATLVLPRAP